MSQTEYNITWGLAQANWLSPNRFVHQSTVSIETPGWLKIGTVALVLT